MFTIILALTALLVAGCAAYFSVLGIATLFSGHYLQVLIMAGSLELGKLVVTSFLYRYWKKTVWFLRLYLITAVFILMCITSMGIYGYLSSGYQVNAGKTEAIDSQVTLIEQQKQNTNKEIEQINQRITTLNEARKAQEIRLATATRSGSVPIYEDMKRSAAEITTLNTRMQTLQNVLIEKDNELLQLQTKSNEIHDIGTFKFVATSLNLSLETIVKVFIIVIVFVFDPLAVSLVLAFNIASRGSILKEPTEKVVEPVQEIVKDIEQEKETHVKELQEEITKEVVPETIPQEEATTSTKTRKFRDVSNASYRGV